MGKGFWVAVVSNTLAKQPQPERLPLDPPSVGACGPRGPGSLLCFLPTGKRRDFLFRGENAVTGASGVKGTFLILIPSSLCFPWVTSRGHRLPCCQLFSHPAFRVDTAASSPKDRRGDDHVLPQEARVWQRPLIKPSVTGEGPQPAAAAAWGSTDFPSSSFIRMPAGPMRSRQLCP